MKETVEDDTMKLPVKRLTQRGCVFFNPIDADVQFCFKGRLAGGRKIKGDDVCIIIMLQEVAVDVEQMIIVTKNNIQRTQWSLCGMCRAGQK